MTSFTAKQMKIFWQKFAEEHKGLQRIIAEILADIWAKKEEK